MRRTRIRPNYQHVKIHRNYDPGEIADLLGVHKNTVLRWIKDGLPLIDKRRPFLILGVDLRAFLQQNRAAKKQKCEVWELFCLKCRSPKKPDLGMVDFKPRHGSVGNLVGLCPDCGTVMNRCMNVATLGQLKGHLDVSIPQALEHIVEGYPPTLNSDFKKAG